VGLEQGLQQLKKTKVYIDREEEEEEKG